MEINFTPDVEKKLNDLAAQSGRGADELLQDALAVYLVELTATRDMLNGRYDELKSGRAKAHRWGGSLCPPEGENRSAAQSPA